MPRTRRLIWGQTVTDPIFHPNCAVNWQDWACCSRGAGRAAGFPHRNPGGTNFARGPQDQRVNRGLADCATAYSCVWSTKRHIVECVTATELGAVFPMSKEKTTNANPLTPQRGGQDKSVATSSRTEIAEFLSAAKAVAPAATGSGRLAFALDATMSRQPTWDIACRLQAEMFDAVGKTGGLAVQLVYFRGLGECRASRWVTDTRQLAELMSRIDCRGGQTQIGRVLRHVADEGKDRGVSALVYIGDAMEENIDHLAVLAGELAMRKIPCFMFHEGHDPAAATGFREIARVTGGAYARFDQNAARELASLLRAVAAYAAGGRKALETSNAPAARLLLEQMSPGRGGSAPRS